MSEEYPVLVEVESDVYLVRGANRSRFPQANCVLIDDDVLTLIDAGADLQNIKQALSKLGHSVTDIDRIVLSHFHIDHKGYAEIIRREADCEVLCHRLGVEATEKFAGLVKCYGHIRGPYYEAWLRFLKTWAPYSLEDYVVTGSYADGQRIDCGKNYIVAIHAPGHTHDHTCFGINGTDIVYLVDIDLTKFGPWYGNVVSDITRFRQAVEKIIELRPRIGLSSHLVEPVTDGLTERLRAFGNAFDERERRIIENIQDGRDTIDQLAHVPIVYPRLPHKVYLMFERIMVEKHVDQLVQQGRLARENGRLVVVE